MFVPEIFAAAETVNINDERVNVPVPAVNVLPFTDVGVIAPRVNVIAGVEEDKATVPEIPFAVTIETDVTEPDAADTHDNDATPTEGADACNTCPTVGAVIGKTYTIDAATPEALNACVKEVVAFCQITLPSDVKEEPTVKAPDTVIDVAVATPKIGVINVGDVCVTNVVPVPVCEVIDVTLPDEVITPDKFALVVTVEANVAFATAEVI